MEGLARFSLEGQVAVVTGGTRGIGRAVALGMAAAGADVIPTGRSTGAIEEVVKEIERRGRRSLAWAMDISDPAQVKQFFEQVYEKFERVDILVNNAGMNPILAPVEQVSLSEWEEIWRVNVTGAFLCSQIVGPRMAGSGGGSVINMSSVLGTIGMAWSTPYSVTKAALMALTRGLAVEWGRKGVRVNCLAPSFVETDLTEAVRSSEASAQYIIRRTLLRRFAVPDEVVGAAIFLASEAASYITGQVLYIDGGWLAQ